MLQGLMLPILIGGGIGAISAMARGESGRNIFKSFGLGALLGGIGGYAMQGIGGAAAGGAGGGAAAGGAGSAATGAGVTGTGATASFMAGSTKAAQQAAANIAAQSAARAPLSTLQSIGIGTTAGQLGSSLAASPPPSMAEQMEMASPYSEEAYAEAYGRARDSLQGIGERAVYADEPAGQQQALYDFQTPRYQLAQGGIVDAIPRYREGGVNYLPSKSDHDENDATNYVRAMGYVEDGSGNGDKDEDTMLAQLADGEFVSRADAILGAGIMAGANPKDMKDMRSKGAKFFYNQQDQLKRIYDIVNDGDKTS
mgnify:FL=1|tara:strand:- start:738 stop:1673 length:936 start_codon:yes stop_codon:yes gene_type:complete